MLELDEQVARSLLQEENAVDLDEEISFSELWLDEDLQPDRQGQLERAPPPISDEALARRLQQEENEKVR